MKVLVLLCAVATTFAAPQYYKPPYQQPNDYPIYNGKPYVPILSESNEINPDGSFSYGYATGDNQQAQARGFVKNLGVKGQEVEVIEGSYSYVSPEGIPITVNYIADENGFRAQGAHLPTPPPIPKEIQQSLALIAQTQRLGPEYQQYEPQNQPPIQQYRPFPQPFRPYRPYQS